MRGSIPITFMNPEGTDSAASIKTPHNATWREKTGGKLQNLWSILTKHRTASEKANIERLLDQCPNPDEALYQWAYANLPNIAIGHYLIQELGEDDPKVIEYRAGIQRARKRKYNHLVWP